MTSIKNILQSGYYKKAESEAGKIAGNTRKVLDFISKAAEKLERLNPLTTGKFSLILEDIKLFFALLKAYYEGRYTEIPWKTIVKMLSAIIYFVYIFDFIPDFIPVVGFLDDIALFAWVIKSIRGDLDKFKMWKEKQLIDETPN